MKAYLESIHIEARIVVAKTCVIIAAMAFLGILMGALFESFS